MRGYALFVKSNANLLLFGFILTFFSGFGQTFLVSLYIPSLGDTFQLSKTGLSALYAGATLGSAFIFPWVGRYIDTIPLRIFAIGVLLGLAVALFTLSIAPNPIIVLLGFWGIRLTGQGLMGHTAVTTMARGYDGDRGKAISISTLGHPAGEAFLPLLVASSIVALGWRATLQLSALTVVIFVLPIIVFILSTVKNATITHPGSVSIQSHSNDKANNPFQLMLRKMFWIIAPGTLLLPYLNTAILFFQIAFGESKGWSPEWVAGSLAFFAIGSGLAMFISGPLVDRFTARRLFPFFTIPSIFGIILLVIFRQPIIYPIALFCLGFANGLGSTIKNAVLAEVFGTNSIGSVRSLFTTIMVFASALGPISFGLGLDNGLSFEILLVASGALAISVALWSLQLIGLKND